MCKVIGITGGIGSGKTAVSDIIKNMGYIVLSSDDIAKELMANNMELQNKLISAFGEDTYNEGKLNSKYISEKVFSDNNDADKNLEKLNNIVHPFVIDELINRVDTMTKQGEKLIFNESALIFEAGLNDGYDYIINVDAPIEIRIERTYQRTGLSKEEIQKRMSKQLSPEEKKRLSDFTIDNSGDLNKLKSSVEFIVDLIKDLPAKDFKTLKQEED